MTFQLFSSSFNAFRYISCEHEVKVRKQWWNFQKGYLVTLSAVLNAQCPIYIFYETASFCTRFLSQNLFSAASCLDWPQADCSQRVGCFGNWLSFLLAIFLSGCVLSRCLAVFFWLWLCLTLAVFWMQPERSQRNGCNWPAVSLKQKHPCIMARKRFKIRTWVKCWHVMEC